MKITKAIKNILIVFVVILIISIIVVILHNTVKSCLPNDIKTNISVSTNESFSELKIMCVYTPDIYSQCRVGDSVSQTTQLCYYREKGFFDTNNGKLVLIILGSLFIILIIIYIVVYVTKKSVSSLEITKHISVKIAKQCVMQRWAIDNNLIYTKYNIAGKDMYYILPGQIKFRETQQPFLENGSWFVLMEFESLSGDQQGIFSIKVNLSRDEEYIFNDNNFYDHVTFHNFKEYRTTRPMAEPKSALQKTIQSLAQVNEEAATNLAERKLFSDVNEIQKEQETTQDSQEQQQRQPIPYSNPRYRNYYRRQRR